MQFGANKSPAIIHSHTTLAIAASARGFTLVFVQSVY